MEWVISSIPLEFPQCWTIGANKSTEENDGSGSDNDSDDQQSAPKSSSLSPLSGSEAYNEFLGFLQLGCSGSPIQGYPAVVIIVSTIPSNVSQSSRL